MRRKIFLTISVFSLLIFSLYFGAAILREPPAEEGELTNVDFTQNQEVIETEEENIFAHSTPKSINKVEEKSTNLKQTAWIPDWDFWNGYSSFENNIEHFDSVSPVWYNLQDNAEITVNKIGLSEIKAKAATHNVKLIPSIANFNAAELNKVLADEEKLEEHINFLINEVEKHDYDGIDIDYESMYLDDQPEFLYLLRQLYNELDPKGKYVTVAVMPNWTDADIYRSLRQTRQGQDWQEIAQYAHEIRIMSYNLTSHTSKYPGPVSPLDWMQAQLRYARAKVDSDKLMLGISLYGYGGWKDQLEVPKPYLSLLSNPYLEEAQASALTYEQVRTRLHNSSVNNLTANGQQKLMRYKLDGTNYIGFYSDTTTVKLRKQLAREFGVAGVAYWRMGSEDQTVYSVN